MSQIMKDCFGTVISSLKKMKECVQCEVLIECRSINWQESELGQEATGTASRAVAGGRGGAGAPRGTVPRSPRGTGS